MEEAFKLNFKTKECEPYELPDGAISLALYSTGYNEVITCAECGKKILYRNICISRKIYTVSGRWYPVCKQCHDKEWEDKEPWKIEDLKKFEVCEKYNEDKHVLKGAIKYKTGNYHDGIIYETVKNGKDE